MRAFGMALVLVAAPASAQQRSRVATSNSLQPFEFRGFTAGVPLTADQSSRCKYLLPGTVTCDGDDRKIAGVEVMSLGIFVSNNVMTMVTIDADPIYFQVLTNAFKAKYGAPCRSVVSRWVGELGNSRPNPTMTWCFKSGKLVAKMYGARLDVSEIEFSDAAQPSAAKPKPKVDF